MPDCRGCGKAFPGRVVIDGKQRNLKNRKYCFDCSPFGSHNTRRSHLPSADLDANEVCDRERECRYCGRPYVYDYRKGHSKTTCNSCIVNLRRYRVKKLAIEYKGRYCVKCGYDGMQCPPSMVFHHRDPHQKEFGIAGNHCLSWRRLQAELDKCDMYCCRCHDEIHFEQDGIRQRYEEANL